MQTNLLDFLFGSSAVHETGDRELGEQIVKLFEDADEVEGVEMVANKKPLATALKSLGIDVPVEAGVQSCELECDDDAEYHEFCRILGTAEAMTKLAEMGWVLAQCGDVAMTNEKPCYKLSFIEIQTAETSDSDKPEDAEKLRKQSQKDATEKFKREGDSNPVELEDPGEGSKDAGIGKPKDGADPEGKPKGSDKNVKESIDDLLESPPQSIQELGGHYCPACKKLSDGKMKDGKCYCTKCDAQLQYPKSSSLRSREAKKKVDEMTSVGSIPAFPDSGVLMGPMHKPANRRRKPPVKQNYAGSPTNS